MREKTEIDLSVNVPCSMYVHMICEGVDMICLKLNKKITCHKNCSFH